MSLTLHKGMYLITDTNIQSRYSHIDLADAAFRAGVQLVQYRAKTSSDQEALNEIRQIGLLESKTNQLLIVNDRPDLARAGGADGVHLGQGDLPISATRKVLGPEKIIGGTASNIEQAQQVEADGADYVALGHIFPTSTKQKKYEPRGLETLYEVSQSVSIPLVAIGGITLQNAADVRSAGADILAVSSAVCCAEDPQAAAQKLVQLFE